MRGIAAAIWIFIFGVSSGVVSYGQTKQPDDDQAHSVVMQFLQGIRIAELPEGKRLLAETQWFTWGSSLPEYTDVNSLYGGLFDTDIPQLKGYKELFDMRATTKAGTTRNLKYLVIAFKDVGVGRWRILSALDNSDSESNVDIEHGVQYFRSQLTAVGSPTSERDHYYLYGLWLLRAGQINVARVALETARTASSQSPIDTYLKRQTEPNQDLDRIDSLINVISKITPR